MIVLRIIGLILAMIGVIMIYDARLISKKYFGFGDQNQATIVIKIIGFIFVIIGGLMCHWGRRFLTQN